MLTIRTTSRLEDAIAALSRRYRQRVVERDREVARRWIALVRQSTWDSPRPAPLSSIIARRLGPGRVQIGWRHYRGSQAAAERRLQARLELYPDEVRDVLRRWRPLRRS